MANNKIIIEYAKDHVLLLALIKLRFFFFLIDKKWKILLMQSKYLRVSLWSIHFCHGRNIWEMNRQITIRLTRDTNRSTFDAHLFHHLMLLFISRFPIMVNLQFTYHVHPSGMLQLLFLFHLTFFFLRNIFRPRQKVAPHKFNYNCINFKTIIQFSLFGFFPFLLFKQISGQISFKLERNGIKMQNKPR